MIAVFTNKKRESIDTFVCAVSIYVAEKPKASIKDQEPQLPIIPYCRVRFVDLSRNSCIQSRDAFRPLACERKCLTDYIYLRNRKHVSTVFLSNSPAA